MNEFKYAGNVTISKVSGSEFGSPGHKLIKKNKELYCVLCACNLMAEEAEAGNLELAGQAD